MAYQTGLGYDPDVVDYSAAIALEQDAATRRELLRQRQNKLDHLAQSGGTDPNWSRNSVVAGWTPAYRPGGWNEATGGYNAYDLPGVPYGGGPTHAVRPAPQGMGLTRHARLDPAGQEALAELAGQQQRALAEAVEQGVAALEGRRQGVQRGYDELARQAAIRYQRSRQDLPASLAAAGLTGGASESALVALESAYREDLHQGELARRAALEALETELGEVRRQGSAEQARAASEHARQVAEDLERQTALLLEQSRWQQQFDHTAQRDAAELALRQRQTEQALSQQQDRQRLQLARLQAELGDFSGYRALGLDTAPMEAEWAARRAAEGASGRTSPGRRATSGGASAPSERREGAEDFSGLASESPLAKETLTPVQLAAVTYVRELGIFFQNSTRRMRERVEEDYNMGYVSRELAAAAMGLLNGSWQVPR